MSERAILLALQTLLVGLPLVLGGNQPFAVLVASAVVTVLLAATLRARRRSAGAAPAVPGLAAASAFVGVAVLTTVPLPPAYLDAIAPATTALYRATLPGWPGGGGWSVWRPLAIDPWGVWTELGRVGLGLGAFVVVAGYPWADRRRVFERVVLTLFASGALVATLGLVGQVAGNGNVLWVTDVPALPARASGPFVNPNHFATWLELLIPLGLVYVVLLAKIVVYRVVGAANTGRGMGVRSQRAWASALVSHQRRLGAPLLAATVLAIMVAAHAASGSRGGAVALFAWLAVTGAGVAAQRGGRKRGWLAPAALAVLLCTASVAMLGLWAVGSGDEGGAAEDLDVSLASRVAVAVEGIGVVRDHPVFGTGLGSWLHAFRPYQAPPVEGGIWDHAHDDYVELAAETGAAGVALALAFALSVAWAVRATKGTDDERQTRRRRPPGFEIPDWRTALGAGPWIRWGLAGGVAAVLVHATVDFGLRMPAVMLGFMTVVALLALGDTAERSGRAWAPSAILAVLAVAVLVQATNDALVLADATPLAPADCRERAERLMGEEGGAARAQALALVTRALDRSPADRETHQVHADVLGVGPAGEAALRRALVLAPWAIEVRDTLGLRLVARGERVDGTAELEESVYQFPYLASHAYLAGGEDLGERAPAQMVRALAEGDTVPVRLAILDADVAAAVESGLRHALVDVPGGEKRSAIRDDLVTLLEARERFAAAAALLHAEAEPGAAGGDVLARAAQDYLRAKDDAGAEQTLLTAVMRLPERGDLYRRLAVEVYAARGDFPTAEAVLEAGERSAVDMRPVYEGVTEVLAKRESYRVQAESPPRVADGAATP